VDGGAVPSVSEEKRERGGKKWASPIRNEKHAEKNAKFKWAQLVAGRDGQN
jgi:hypothetical protein